MGLAIARRRAQRVPRDHAAPLVALVMSPSLRTVREIIQLDAAQIERVLAPMVFDGPLPVLDLRPELGDGEKGVEAPNPRLVFGLLGGHQNAGRLAVYVPVVVVHPGGCGWHSARGAAGRAKGGAQRPP